MPRRAARAGSAATDTFEIPAGALPDQQVTEKLQAEAAVLAAEGWKWIEVATDLPYPRCHPFD